MTRRRTFLRLSGATALGGLLAGCQDQLSPGSDAKTTDSTTTDSGQSGNESDTETEDDAEKSTDDSTGRFHLANTNVLDDFEDMSGWEAREGEVEAASPTAFMGSQSLHLTAAAAESGDTAAWASKGVDWDLSGQTLSLATRPTSPGGNLLVEVRLHAPDEQNILTMGELFRLRENQGWLRLDLATRDFAGNPDLSNVKRVDIGVRAASARVDFHFDDLRAVPQPGKGSVILTFDDSLDSHYQEAFPRMREYDMPGNAAVITDRVGSNGTLDTGELKEMQDAGWDVVSHSTTNEKLTDKSPQQMTIDINDVSDWLAQNGFDSGKASFVYPHGAWDDTLIDAVSKKHKQAFRYMDPLSAASGRITDPYTISRGNAAYNIDLSKTMVNYAEQFNHNVVLTFHDIVDNGGDLAMSPGTFNDLLAYIDRRDVEVKTLSHFQNQLAD